MRRRAVGSSCKGCSGRLWWYGIGAAPSAVRCFWKGHGLVVRYQRLLQLERKTADRRGY